MKLIKLEEAVTKYPDDKIVATILNGTGDPENKLFALNAYISAKESKPIAEIH